MYFRIHHYIFKFAINLEAIIKFFVSGVVYRESLVNFFAAGKAQRKIVKVGAALANSFACRIRRLKSYRYFF